ncbi:MAG TPA: hypothetical protein VFH56_08405 [Acidimicrobiales bacterium]|nr:hypothetical protein [Acidimicrobiales bacterium]
MPWWAWLLALKVVPFPGSTFREILAETRAESVELEQSGTLPG